MKGRKDREGKGRRVVKGMGEGSQDLRAKEGKEGKGEVRGEEQKEEDVIDEEGNSEGKRV